jgi:hypothetical protein
MFRAMVLTTAVMAWVLPAVAQGMRDPTIPPFGTGGAGEQGEGAAQVRGLHAPLSVILVDGKFRLVVGTRLYAEGQKVGDARIERISETEVWFREGRELRKLSNFVGVKRRTVTGAAAVPRPQCGAGSAKPSDSPGPSNMPVPVEGCSGAQP